MDCELTGKGIPQEIQGFFNRAFWPGAELLGGFKCGLLESQDGNCCGVYWVFFDDANVEPEPGEEKFGRYWELVGVRSSGDWCEPHKTIEAVLREWAKSTDFKAFRHNSRTFAIPKGQRSTPTPTYSCCIASFILEPCSPDPWHVDAEGSIQESPPDVLTMRPISLRADDQISWHEFQRRHAPAIRHPITHLGRPRGPLQTFWTHRTSPKTAYRKILFWADKLLRTICDTSVSIHAELYRPTIDDNARCGVAEQH